MQGIDISKLKDSLFLISPAGIFVSTFLVVISDILISYRWKYISNKSCNFKASFEATVLSGLLNFALPAKLGEIAKVIFLNREHRLKISDGTQILIYERSLDVFLLTVLASFLVLNFANFSSIKYYIPLLFGLFLFLILIVKGNFLDQFLKKILPISYYDYFLEVKLGLNNQLKFKNILVSFLITIIIWASFFFTTYFFLVYSVNVDLSFHQILSVFIISSIAMSIPISPGGIGVFQAGVVYALSIFNIEHNIALVAGIFLHLVLLLPSIILAVIVLLRLKLNISSLKQ